MMDPKAHWERIYQDRSPASVSWYQREPTLSLAMIKRCALGREEALIDVGGGASVLVDRLLLAGYENVTVLDIAASALAHARARLGETAGSVTWIESDVTVFDPPQVYALWHDRAVFHFLTDADDRRRYVAALKRALRPDGHLILAAFSIGGPTRCSGLDIVQYDAHKLGTELGPAFSLQEECDEVHRTPGGAEQRFGFFRFAYTAQE
ncbi:MAG: hypothetical protein AMJ69_09015 [Gammaproteobacteria bacterium SG8_47]|nr:MAG: hypothetical protein AMJ69_09015 [Gammaproteobacteria bacterium SG8_47]